MIQRAPTALMAAVSLMMRILLVCWLSDLLFSSTISAELQGGGWDLRRFDYGNRRPLHYVRTLRPPIIKSSQASGGHGNVIRSQKKPQKQTLRLPQVFSSWPAQQRNPPPARPRGFQLNLDIPFLELGQNQMPHTVSKGSRESPAVELNLRSSPQSSLFSVPEKSTQDPNGWKSDHVPKLQHDISPSSAAKTQSLSASDYLRLAHLIKDRANVQSRYIEPAQQLLALMQPESRPPLNYADTIHKQLTQMGSKWPILSSDAVEKQNQEVASEKPAAKENVSWHSAQHGSPALSLAEQSWAHEKPDVGKSSRHSTRKHPERVDWHSNTHTSVAQEEKDHTLLSKPNLPSSSVLQREVTHQYFQLNGDRKYGTNYDPHIELKGSVKLPDPAFGKGSQTTAEAGRDSSPQRLHFSLSLPIQAKTQNVEVQGIGNQNVKTAQQMSTQTGSNWPSSSSDYRKSAPQTETKWPISSFEAGHQNYQQQPQDNIQTKPAGNSQFSAQYSNRQTPPWYNQDETLPGLGPAFHKPATTKASSVSYSPTHTRHDSYINYPGPRNDLDHAAGLTQSLSQTAPSLYHSSSDKFSEHSHGIKHPSAHQRDHYGRLKPSTAYARTAERMHLGSTRDLKSLSPPNWYAGAAAATSVYDTRRPHQKQKHVFSEASSRHRHKFPSGPESQKTFPEWEAGQHDHDGRDKSAKVFINFEHASVATDGQSDTKTDDYHGKWDGDTGGPQSQTTNPSTLNLQALLSLDKGALAQLLKSSHQSRKPSYLQSGCMGQAGDCSQQINHFPRPDSYSPYAEATLVTVPSNAQQQFFESRSYHF